MAVSRDWAESAKEVTAISVIFWSMVRGQVAAVIERHKDNMPWLYRSVDKKAYNVAVVAQANKTARILWSMLVHHTEYRTLSAV
ncbi:putative transposase [Yersinia enterocolitica]|nr:putative transposase [Yersinia enterocolitica]